MTNTDSLLLELSKLETTFSTYISPFEYNRSDFEKDWLENKLENWEPALMTVLERVNRLIKSIEEANAFIFPKALDVQLDEKWEFDDFESKNKFTYPKEVCDFDSSATYLILESKKEEQTYWLRKNSSEIKPKLLFIKEEIEASIRNYQENRSSSPYFSEILTGERIPFIGSERMLTFVMVLLVRAGFFPVEEETMKNISDETRQILKAETLKKTEFASRIAKTFCYVKYDSNTKNIIKTNVSPKISAKMQVDQKKHLMNSELNELISRFEQIVKDLKS